MIVLSGDIGGTTTRLMLAEVDGTRVQPLFERSYPSKQWPGFRPLLGAFLTEACDTPSPQRACIAVAGPVIDNRCNATNLPWALNVDTLSRDLGSRPAQLINDFEGSAYGIAALGPDDMIELQRGSGDATGLRCVIGAGTGFGAAIIVPQGSGFRIFTTEAGHADFAPADEEQLELIAYLRRSRSRVSVEGVLSGPGLVNICHYLQDVAGITASRKLTDAMKTGDPATTLSHFGLSGQDKLAQRTLELFIHAYGAHAGNIALACLPQGGLYLAGGIAPKVLNEHNRPRFLNAFHMKDPMAPLLKTVPIHLITNPKVGLIGAAVCGAYRTAVA